MWGLSLIHISRARDADVYNRIGFPRSVERTRHERVVLDGVAEHDELAGSDALAVGGRFSGRFHDARHFEHGIHVDARTGRADIDRRTYVVGNGKGVGDRLHELGVGLRRSLTVSYTHLDVYKRQQQGVGPAVVLHRDACARRYAVPR